ncbi:MAG: FAD-binding protein [Gammaproteobacteria bacterium]|nr:FAD-binding protein [Gammaproteobacteria bacterium]
MRAIIIGAGIGGLTAALTLRRAGYDVQVFEQTSALREVGAGIQISPNGSRLLQRVGLGPALARRAVRPGAMVMRRWQDGAVLSSQTLANLCESSFGAPYYHLYRPDLLALLAEALPADVVRLGHQVIDVFPREDSVEVRFAHGVSTTADLLIGADGLHSSVREVLFGAESPRYSGTVAYRGLVPAERLPQLGTSHNMNGWLGPQRHFMQYYVAAARYVNFVGIAPAAHKHVESWSAQAPVAECLAEFADWHPEIQSIIRAVEVTGRWALYDREPLAHWSLGRVSLLGDAAHAMLPFMAQGAVQSVEDAFVLAKCLEHAHHSSIPEALVRYETIRRPRVSQVQARARENAHTFHLPDGEAQRQRDAELAAVAGTNPLLASTWLYGFDAEAEFG